MLFGEHQAVEYFKTEMMGQKFPLRIYKEGKKDQQIFMGGRLSTGPFGVFEYCFPKECMDQVLTSLSFNQTHYPKLGKARIAILRTMLGCKKTPEFSEERRLVWFMKDVGIIPIGIREDGELLEPAGPYKGWTHEGI